MSDNPDVFSLPGFTPLASDDTKDRIEAGIDGSVAVIFYKDRPINERTPVFYIMIGKEFGNQVTVYREFNNHFVQSIRHEKAPLKDYRFLVEAKDVTLLPGNYVIRFFAEQQQVAVKYLCVKNTLLLSPKLPPSFLA